LVGYGHAALRAGRNRPGGLTRSQGKFAELERALGNCFMVALIKHETITPREGQTSTCKSVCERRSPRRICAATISFEANLGGRESRPQSQRSAKAGGGGRGESNPWDRSGSGIGSRSEVKQRRRFGAPKAGSAMLRWGTTFKLYLREIGQVKLLTRQEENQLPLDQARGQEAREQMIKANLRLVVRLPATTKALACRCWT